MIFLLGSLCLCPDQTRKCSADMTARFQHGCRGSANFPARAGAVILITAVALGGCSINLGSLLPGSEPKETPASPSVPPSSPSPSPAGDRAAAGDENAADAIARGQSLARSGKTEEALAAFDRALDLDPYNAQAFYHRGLLYQTERQHPQAVADFTSANGLMPQWVDPLVGRAVSYLAMEKVREAASDLDEAVQADPQNGQAWVTRGLAYERLGDKAKAAGSFARALAIRPKDEAARVGFARVGGKSDQTYNPF
jgi:tetratricopeptide (TPR) repeat protein